MKVEIPETVLKQLLFVMNERARTAADVASRFHDAVRPIFAFNLDRPVKNVRPDQIGSGVLFKLNGNCFILSAAHCFEHFRNFQVIVACGTKLHFLSGESYLSRKGPSGTHSDDQIDAAIFHIGGEVPGEIIASCLMWDDLDFGAVPKERDFHVALGYRTKRSRWRGRVAESELEKFVFGEYTDHEYERLGLSRATHVALTWEKSFFMNGIFQSSPSPKGMSGGAIVRIDGLRHSPESSTADLRGRLAGITIELRSGSQKKPSVLVGTRVGCHMGLIAQVSSEMADVIRELTKNN